MKAMTFNIQKFSIHDGPGIRTTVFLKGCPLRCKWCANPESQLAKVQILWKKENCRQCGTCVQVCPHQAITMTEDGTIQVDFHKCDGCLECTKHCPGQALSHEGNEKNLQDIVDECLQDLDFYEESGGGVTISGGEGMIQPEFASAFVQELKKHGIHTAIETTGAVPAETFQFLAPQFDLLLFDVKQASSAKHKAGTMVGNEQIVENLKWAVDQGLNVLPRIPVIPGFNAELEDAREISDLLAEIGLKKVQLLPFHQMGEKKYEFLNRPYAYKDVKALHPEDLQDYQQIFLDRGLDCFF